MQKALGDIAPQSITPNQLDRAVTCYINKDGDLRSAATLNKLKSAFRSLFHWLNATGQTATNPAAFLHLSRPCSRRTLPISLSEIDTLLTTIRQATDPLARRDEALFATYAITGLRRNEVLALQVQDVDCNAAVLWPSRTKNGRRNGLAIPARLTGILKRYLGDLPNHPLYRPKPRFLFPGRHPDRALSSRQVTLRFELWRERSAIRSGLTLHSFRAGFATIVYGNTPDLLLVSRAMGHCDPRSTERYIADNGAIRQVLNRCF